MKLFKKNEGKKTEKLPMSGNPQRALRAARYGMLS